MVIKRAFTPQRLNQINYPIHENCNFFGNKPELASFDPIGMPITISQRVMVDSSAKILEKNTACFVSISFVSMISFR